MILFLQPSVCGRQTRVESERVSESIVPGTMWQQKTGWKVRAALLLWASNSTDIVSDAEHSTHLHINFTLRDLALHCPLTAMLHNNISVTLTYQW